MDVNIWIPSRSGDVLINVSNRNSAHQVHLSAVIPTIPVAESSTLQRPVVGSNMTTVISNLHTGTLSSLALPNSRNKVVVFCRSCIGVCSPSVTRILLSHHLTKSPFTSHPLPQYQVRLLWWFYSNHSVVLHRPFTSVGCDSCSAAI